MIAIIDYGLGNLRSIEKAFERQKVHAVITNDIDLINKAEKLVLPGVGHFESGMKNLIDFGLVNILNKKVLEEKVLILGICLGMQLMTDFSEEGNCSGLGWIRAKTTRFNLNKINSSLKIPHMGWNNINIMKNCSIMSGIESDALFYFVHSYFVTCDNDSEVLTNTIYGHEFHSGFKKDNIIGFQFHPEKSHDAGLQILRNFAVM